MDTVRRTATDSGRGRAGSLLGVALAAATALSVLSPAAAAPSPLVDVVVTSAGAGVAGVADAVRAAGGVVRDALPVAGGVTAQLPAGTVLAPSFQVTKNAPLSLAQATDPALDREPTAVRAALGLGDPAGEGAGVTVAVVDTGVADSPEFGDRLTHYAVPGTKRKKETADPYGHGTFVAGVVAGAGVENPAYAGVAPGADVLDIRVANRDGKTDLIKVLKGLQKAAELGADVVNLSMTSGSTLPYQIDPLTIALDNLWASGVVVVVPSGNEGGDAGTVGSPGLDPMLLTVGALDEKTTPADRSDDGVAPFSGRGPTTQGDAKPDLVAPGTSVVSVRSPGSWVDTTHPASRIGEAYFRGSGTSFATAATAGASATLLQQRSNLSPDQVKGLVRGTAYSAAGLADVHAAGAGGLDLPTALVTPAPPVVEAPADVPPAGDEAAWDAFRQAMRDGDRAAAARAWSQLSPEGHRWGANSWSGHRWGANSWSGHRWGANSWSGHRWGANSWSGHRWGANSWA